MKTGNHHCRGDDQLLNAREYFLLNHFPASETVQGATITPEQYFDLYLYDDLLGFDSLPETPAFTEISRMGELFVEASYRKMVPFSEDDVEVHYQYGREGVAERVFYMKRDAGSERWLIQE